MRIGSLSLDQALNIPNRIGLNRNEIIAYINGQFEIGFYEISSFDAALNPANTMEINNIISYNPPQSFVILSKFSKKAIDNLCRFEISPIAKEINVDD